MPRLPDACAGDVEVVVLIKWRCSALKRKGECPDQGEAKMWWLMVIQGDGVEDRVSTRGCARGKRLGDAAPAGQDHATRIIVPLTSTSAYEAQDDKARTQDDQEQYV